MSEPHTSFTLCSFHGRLSVRLFVGLALSAERPDSPCPWRDVGYIIEALSAALVLTSTLQTGWGSVGGRPCLWAPLPCRAKRKQVCVVTFTLGFCSPIGDPKHLRGGSTFVICFLKYGHLFCNVKTCGPSPHCTHTRLTKPVMTNYPPASGSGLKSLRTSFTRASLRVYSCQHMRVSRNFPSERTAYERPAFLGFLPGAGMFGALCLFSLLSSQQPLEESPVLRIAGWRAVGRGSAPQVEVVGQDSDSDHGLRRCRHR